MAAGPSRPIARFGLFEADFQIGELRRQGRLVPLQEQPLLILAALVERAGEEVSRDQLRHRLWPDQGFLDFETGINTAVAKLRQALGDSAENPRFIATRPRHGYRLIVPVSWTRTADDPLPQAPVAAAEPRAAEVEDSQGPRRRGRTQWRSWRMAGAVLLVLLAGVGLLGRRGPLAAILGVVYRSPSTPLEAPFLSIYAPAGESLTGSFAMSPTGTSLAFVSGGATPLNSRLWLRSLDGMTTRMLPGTEGAAMPFWSPDGRAVGFFARGKLKTIDVESGVVVEIADAPRGRGGSWSRNGVILFAPDISSSIFSVSASGGRAVPATDLAGSPSHRFPSFLPDGQHFVYLLLREDRDLSEIWWGVVGSASSGRLLPASSNALYVEPGYLLFTHRGLLLAQPFDTATLRPTGQALVVSEEVSVYGESGPTGLGAFSVSANGSLAMADFVPPPLRLSWYDRDGRERGTVGPPAQYTFFDLSPDGTRAAFTRFDARKRSTDLLTVDLTTSVVTQVTDDPWPDSGGYWSPRGDRLVFESLRNGRWQVLIRDASGAGGEQLLASEPYVYSWFPDGQSVVVGLESPETGIDLWKLPIDAGGRPTPLVVGDGNQTEGQVSPDGRRLAYASDQEGERDIYVRDLDTGDCLKVSSGGGDLARWRRDGRELFYLSGRTLMSVAVRNPTLGFGRPQRLFQPPLPPNDTLGEVGAAATFGVAPDGSSFLFAVPVLNERQPAIHVLSRWRVRSGVNY